MEDLLWEFSHANDSNEITFDNDNGQFKIVLRLEGETCWEKSHPTFISKKRKVILTCPRKVGHSSIRFYLNSQNEMFDDDWIWLENQNRNPKFWLEEEEYEKFVRDILSENKRAVLIPAEEDIKAITSTNNPYLQNVNIMKYGSDDAKEYFGDYNSWDYGTKSVPLSYEKRQVQLTPPLQTLDFFKDWTTYLLVREPWDRFISGLITEMDMGMSTPWKYDREAHSEEGWDKIYNSAKRMLYFSDPDWILLGGLDGQQMNHTFILSRPKWEGKSMYDVYDKFIHYKHDIDYKLIDECNGKWMQPNQESLKKTTGVIDSLIKLNFINDEVKEKHHTNDSHNNSTHTHMNITPHIRQHVIQELQEDEDLKEWWDRCHEIVNWDYEDLKNNQHKF